MNYGKSVRANEQYNVFLSAKNHNNNVVLLLSRKIERIQHKIKVDPNLIMTSSLSSSSSLLSLSLLLFVLLCGNNNKVNAEEVTIVDSVDLNVDKYYNVNESRGEFEFRIKDYPLPIGTLYCWL